MLLLKKDVELYTTFYIVVSKIAFQVKKKKGASWRKVCIIYWYSSKKSGKEITVSQKVGKKKKSCLEWSGGKGEEEKENSEHIFPYIFDTNM